ncbi:hypothetical protein TgHK011_009959 [Trichoderma gracile]|nr:hypothetical protein TgHK011_009959 [Trichoderma gracile]
MVLEERSRNGILFTLHPLRLRPRRCMTPASPTASVGSCPPRRLSPARLAGLLATTAASPPALGWKCHEEGIEADQDSGPGLPPAALDDTYLSS